MKEKPLFWRLMHKDKGEPEENNLVLTIVNHREETDEEYYGRKGGDMHNELPKAQERVRKGWSALDYVREGKEVPRQVLDKLPK